MVSYQSDYNSPRTNVLTQEVGRLSSLVDQQRAQVQELQGELQTRVATMAQENQRLQQQLGSIEASLGAFIRALQQDGVIATALNQAGFSVGNANISALAASKLTGDVATAQMQTNAVAAVVANGADIAAANMDGNLVAAWVAAASGFTYGPLTGNGNIGTTGTLATGNASITGTAVVSGNATLQGALAHQGTTAGLYNVTPVAQQTVAQMTNSVASGGTANTITGWTVPQAFGTVEQTILDNYYQLGEKVKQLETALRTLGATKN